MRTLHSVFVCLFLFGCGGETAPQQKEQKQYCYETQRALPLKMELKVFLDPDAELNPNFVLSSLNHHWRETGVSIVATPSPEEANFGVVYVHGWCKYDPIMVGRLNFSYWSNLSSIIIDYYCFRQEEYMRRFPSAVSHALGRVMGVLAYPNFCSQGIMSTSVIKMQEKTPPSKLSSEDKQEFLDRERFIQKSGLVKVCVEKKEWRAGEQTNSSEKTHKFYLDPSFTNPVRVEKNLNRYFAIFNQRFELARNKDDADFAIHDWYESYKGCSPTAVARSLERAIYAKREQCLAKEESEASVMAHEVGHLFGMEHIPSWCGNAIMNPSVNPGSSFTPTDVKAWYGRNLRDPLNFNQPVRATPIFEKGAWKNIVFTRIK